MIEGNLNTEVQIHEHKFMNISSNSGKIPGHSTCTLQLHMLCNLPEYKSIKKCPSTKIYLPFPSCNRPSLEKKLEL